MQLLYLKKRPLNKNCLFVWALYTDNRWESTYSISICFFLQKTIQLNSVGAIDAGTYVCSATSQKRTLDIPIILVVTGIIPYFTQAPNSFISLPTLPDAYLQFSFEVSFKPENDYGLILYNGNRERERDADFISLGLENGIPEFKFNLGPGTPTTTVRSNETLTEREWHTIKIVRNKKRGKQWINA